MSKSLLGFTLLLVLLLLGVTSVNTFAQAGGYHIAWWTLDSGGGASAFGRYQLTGTIGQPDASTVLQGGAYRLTGGYWGEIGYEIFLPLVLQEE